MGQCGLWEDGEQSPCPLEQECAKGDVFALMARLALTDGKGRERAGCHDFDRGRYCGTTLAYYEAAVLTTQLAELDETAPITHFGRITKTPAGEAPEVVREAIVGLNLHIRAGLQPPEINGVVAIHPLDFILALHDQGKITEAAWYKAYNAEQITEAKQVEAWHFQADEMDIWENKIPRGTANQYARNAWTYSMLGSVWIGYILPEELFYPQSEQGQAFFAKLREAYEGEDNTLAPQLVTDIFRQNNLMGIVRRGPGRTTSYDAETNEVTEVWDAGVLVYDRDQGIDNR